MIFVIVEVFVKINVEEEFSKVYDNKKCYLYFYEFGIKIIYRGNWSLDFCCLGYDVLLENLVC